MLSERTALKLWMISFLLWFLSPIAMGFAGWKLVSIFSIWVGVGMVMIAASIAIQRLKR